MKKMLKNKKGFTLVELMVVVAILGILVAVAIPVYSSVTDKAERNTCVANIRTVESAVMQAVTNGDAKILADGKVTLNDGTTALTVAALKTGINGHTYLVEEPHCPSDKTDTPAAYAIGANGAVTCGTKATDHTKAKVK